MRFGLLRPLHTFNGGCLWGGSMQSGRSLRLDNAKGALIILVVLGHFLWQYREDAGVSTLVLALYVFHMPAFVLISGYLSGVDLVRNARGAARLLAMYVLANGLMTCLVVAATGAAPSLLDPYYSFWYLLSLICWRLTLPFVASFRLALPLCTAAALASGFAPEIGNDLSLMRTIAFYPFFLLGYRLRSRGVDEGSIEGRRRVGAAMLAVGIAAAVAAVALFGVGERDVMMYAYRDGLAAGLARRMAVLAIALVASVGLVLALPDRRLPAVTGWGARSLPIYLFHRFATLAFVKVLPAPAALLSPVGAASLVATLATCAILGSVPFARLWDRLVDRVCALARIPEGPGSASREALGTALALLLIVTMVLQGTMGWE